MLTLPNSALAADFCVADLATGGETPSGYPCKDPANVTVDDFIYTGFVHKGNTTNNPNRVAFDRAFVQRFPALNGLNLAVFRIDMEAEGVVPLHTHPYSSELILVNEGKVTAGFITALPSNAVYVKELNRGEVMVIPRGLLHFIANSGGRNNAVVFTFYGSSDPGIQVVSHALFQNNLSALLVQKTTGISLDDVKSLKAKPLFGWNI
ncbi:Germin-like protein 1 [Linum grandiflorum]